MVVKITISLPEELAKFAEDLARESNRPKSHVFAELLAKKRNDEVLESLAKGYRELAQANLQFAEEALPLAAEIWDVWVASEREAS